MSEDPVEKRLMGQVGENKIEDFLSDFYGALELRQKIEEIEKHIIMNIHTEEKKFFLERLKILKEALEIKILKAI